MPNYATDHGDASPSARVADRARPCRIRRAHSPKNAGGHASMMSSSINLLNTIVGAGILAMPRAMSHFGVMLGVLLIMWCGLTSAFGLYLQARCARYVDRGSSSFFALSQITYPSAAVFFDAAIAVKCFGVGVSYLIIISDLMPGVARGFTSRADMVPLLVDRNFWCTAFMMVVIPLSFLRRLDSLKYTSIVALVSIGYLIILVVYHFATDSNAERGPIHVLGWGGPVAAFSSLPVIIFAYTCHQNMFSILNEIKDNSPASFVGVISASIGSAATIYMLVAITGYLTFGNAVAGNIVAMYPTTLPSTIGKAAIVVLVTSSVPLQIHPCRASVDAVLGWVRKRLLRHPSGAASLRSLVHQESVLPILGTHQVSAQDSHGSSAAPMSDMRFAVLTTIILVLSYMTAINVSTLDRVLAYVGSTGSTAISFILPGLFYYKISDPESIYHQRLTKEDDDAETRPGCQAGLASDDSDEAEEQHDAGCLADNVASLRSNTSHASGASSVLHESRLWRLRRRWRWDLEHLETSLLRKLALALSAYGALVMVSCLVMNAFFTVAH